METILGYILDEEFIHRLFVVLAIAGPIGGLAIGAVIGVVRKQTGIYSVWGLAIGAFGTLNLGLWYFYNYITAQLGLDTVKNLVVNLVVFAAIGLLLGIVYRILPRPSRPQDACSPTPQPEHDPS